MNLAGFFPEYCYGPVDILGKFKDKELVCLSLRDALGKTAQAFYEGCVYWHRDDFSLSCRHLSLVRKISPEDLLCRKDSYAFSILQQMTADAASQIQAWADEGLSFYLHYGDLPKSEYLAVARSLVYHGSEGTAICTTHGNSLA